MFATFSRTVFLTTLLACAALANAQNAAAPMPPSATPMPPSAAPMPPSAAPMPPSAATGNSATNPWTTLLTASLPASVGSFPKDALDEFCGPDSNQTVACYIRTFCTDRTDKTCNPFVLAASACAVPAPSAAVAGQPAPALPSFCTKYSSFCAKNANVCPTVMPNYAVPLNITEFNRKICATPSTNYSICKTCALFPGERLMKNEPSGNCAPSAVYGKLCAMNEVSSSADGTYCSFASASCSVKDSSDVSKAICEGAPTITESKSSSAMPSMRYSPIALAIVSAFYLIV